MSSPSPVPGTFLAIPLADGSFGYGRQLAEPHLACYWHRTSTPSIDLAVIESSLVLFTVAVQPPHPPSWKHLGWRPLTGELARPVVRFTQDVLDPSRCLIFDSAGLSRYAEPAECVGLERAAVWVPAGVEQRLLDTLLGRPNEDEVRARVRLLPRTDQ